MKRKLLRVALIHDRLTEYGGAERVLHSLLRCYPGADVYTAFMDPMFVDSFFPTLPKKRIHTSVLQIIYKWGYLFQFAAPWIWKFFHLEKYDVVISISSFFLSNTVRVKRPLHIQYILCPPKNVFNLSPKIPVQKYIPYEHIVRTAYVESLTQSNHVITLSHHMQEQIKRITGVSSIVIYPPVSTIYELQPKKTGNYFLSVSRLDDSKGIDLLIRACTRLQLQLKVVGHGSDPMYVRYLKSIAGPTVELLGFLPDEKITPLYEHAKAFIFTAKNEDFGIAPVEAMAHGVPVIAHHSGGAKETVILGKTGEFYHQYSVEALMNCIKKFNSKHYNRHTIQSHALKYSESRFINEVQSYVQSALTNADYAKTK